MRHRESFFERAWMIGLSVVLSVLLWLQVSAMEDQVAQQSFRARLELRGLPDQLAVIGNPYEVEVVAEGPSSKLREIADDDYRAIVNLTGATAGVGVYRVTLNGPASSDYTVNLKSARIKLELAQVGRREMAVNISEKGHMGSDLQYGGANAEPNRVTIIGAEPLLERVSQVRAFLDLTKLRPGDTPIAPLEVLGMDGAILTGVRVEPPAVTLRARLVAAPATVNVLVTPRWVGTPAFGYEVDSVIVEPNQVTLTGESRVLAAIQKVWTEPIDLTGLKTSKTVTVPLQVPSGTKSSDPSVRVEVRLNKIAPTAVPEPSAANP